MINKLFKLALCLSVIAFSSCSSDDDSPQGPLTITIEGASVTPEVGGPNQQNQVYVDLSTNTTTSVQRDSWDLGFYSGSDFRVVINSSIYMATAQLSTTNIDAVSSSTQEVVDLQSQVAVGTFEDANMEFIDAPDGSLSNTAIAQIADNDENNNVYLVNLGDEVGTETPSTGSVDVSDDSRGWKKIRILKDGNNYILQYADLNDSTHEEITITKNTGYHFTFFSFNTESIVNVEPESTQWDLNFTVFTNEIEGYGSYGYSDYVLNNSKSNALVYMIDTETDAVSYEDFTLSDVNDINFTIDQRGVGSSWRNGGGPGSLPSLKDNVFYIVNDTSGNLYKLKFLALTNEAGERGYPEFVYSLIQE
nr:HmuY family protein [uncultured Psychroserpens sp.]